MSDVDRAPRKLRPDGADRNDGRIVVVDPGYLPTTRQMAIAVVDRLSDYYTPYIVDRRSRLLALPRLGRQIERRALPDKLAGRVRAIDTGTELLRVGLQRAGVSAYNYSLIWRRNIHIDAQIPLLLKAGDTVIGQYGGCLESFRRAHVLYGRAVLDYPIARVDAGLAILAEEAELRPEFADSLAGDPVHQEHIERMAAEVDLADTIVVGSTFAAASFEGVVAPGRVQVVPYGVNTDAFRPKAGPPRVGPLRVLFAGQLSQRKGIAYLLDAMRQLDRDQFELTLAGSIIGSGVGLHGYTDLYTQVSGTRPQDMPQVYREADVLVLPSLLEGSALVVLEAMASGLPVIVTPNAGADAVRDGIDGYVVPVRSPKAIAERLQRLRNDPALRSRMGAAARSRALEFTWQAFHRSFRSVLRLPVLAEDSPEELSA